MYDQRVPQITHAYRKDTVDWGRPEVMRHMLAGENMALATTRSIEIGGGTDMRSVRTA